MKKENSSLLVAELGV